MKKPLLSFQMAHSWNKLLRKFFKIFRRFETLRTSFNASSIELNHLQRKMQGLFNRLSKLQSRVGIKIAGSAIALMLMSANLSAQTYTNSGTVSSSSPTPISMGLLTSISTGDIDGDGDMDIVAGEYFGGTYVFKNDGGTFSNESSLIVDGVPVSVGLLPAPTLADVDEDGDLDLYIGALYGNIKVGLNDGTGVFTSAPDMQADGALLDVGSLAFPKFADVDEDGDLDLYVSENNGVIKVFRNNGSGIFSSAGNLQAGGVDIVDSDFLQFTFFDLNADGDLDLYVGLRNGAIKVYSNNGSGVFTAQADFQSSGMNVDAGDYASPAFIDIDDDGDTDLLVGNYSGSILVYQNLGGGIFSDLSTLEARNIAYKFDQFSAPTFADIDEDEDLDIFVGLYSGTISTLNNDGTGQFSRGPSMMADNILLNVGLYAMPEFADIDEDGDLDLFVGNSDGFILEYQNDGAGVFSFLGNLEVAAVDIDAGNSASPVFADLDGDADLDLYVGSMNGNILVFENNGAGVFTAATVPLFVADGVTLDVGSNSSPDFHDLDDDGDLDLLVGEYFGRVKVFYNEGAGSFTEALGYFQADGSDVDVYYLGAPKMANVDGGCGPDLYLGGFNSPILHFDYKDTLAPTIACPTDLTYNLLQFQNNYTVSGATLDPISTSDNCNIESVLNDFNGNATLAGVDFPAGTETITWTVIDVDGNTQTCSVDVTVNVFNAIDDLSAMGILMYPNPSTGIFSIENAQNFNILISDAFGKTIANYTNVQDAKFELDLTNSPAGIYFITISNETEVRTAKMVIE